MTTDLHTLYPHLLRGKVYKIAPCILSELAGPIIFVLWKKRNQYLLDTDPRA